NACIPARIPVNEFTPNRTQRRTWRRNGDVRVETSSSIRDEAAYDLYYRYIEQRHADGDMYPPDREQYHSFLNDAWDCTRYYRFFAGDTLLGIAVVDVLTDGLSAIYTFFEPEEDKRSLGSFAILWQIELARKLELEFLYLGYWIRSCNKMAYKTDYRPLELYLDSEWQLPDKND
ncbi:MAG: arginyltransferase, partial [Haliea sp.]|nr:arginyltransferase [Haliea sp.]